MRVKWHNTGKVVGTVGSQRIKKYLFVDRVDHLAPACLSKHAYSSSSVSTVESKHSIQELLGSEHLDTWPIPLVVLVVV